jgi:hypothetical protein
MPLRIAFDLDGVLADMDSELRRQAEFLFGGPIESSAPEPGDEDEGSAAGAAGEAIADPAPDFTPPATRLALTRHQQRRLWQHVRSIENFWERLEETEPGVVGRLAALTASCRWEIIFLTKRPDTAGLTAQLQSQRWLEEKGFRMPSVFVVQGSRGRIAAALDLNIVVDDRLENCLDVVTDSKARAILVLGAGETHPSAANRLGIGVVTSVGDCLDILNQIDAARREPPGVMSRIMRLLGLKEAARL